MKKGIIAGFLGATVVLLALIIMIINEATLSEMETIDMVQVCGQASREIVTIQEQAVPAAAVPQVTVQSETEEGDISYLTQEDEIQETETQETETQETEIQETKIQETETQETKTQEVETQKPNIQELEAQEAKASVADTGSLIEDVISRVNRVRSENGLSPLTTTAQVMDAANIRAREIQQSFSHQRPDGSDSVNALNDAGAAYGYAGENLFCGFSTAADVEQAWNHSSIHRGNVLCANYNHIGVGYVSTSNGLYLVQVFTD